MRAVYYGCQKCVSGLARCVARAIITDTGFQAKCFKCVSPYAAGVQIDNIEVHSLDTFPFYFGLSEADRIPLERHIISVEAKGKFLKIGALIEEIHNKIQQNEYTFAGCGCWQYRWVHFPSTNKNNMLICFDISYFRT